VAFPLALMVFAQNDAASQRITESLTKTQNRIKEILLAHTSFKQMNPIGYEAHRIEAAEFKGCSMTYRSVRSIEEKGLRFIGSYSLTLGDIDPARIMVKKELYHYSVWLPTQGGKKKIKLEHTTYKHNQSAGSTQALDKVVISFNDLSMAEETAKALAEVIRLCQNQKQP
jgi:hypothetical protein